MNKLIIKRIETFVFRAPLKNLVRTSFGIMRDRPALLVRVEDQDGVYGWGEVWCNFPSVGAEHRAALINEIVGPMLINHTFNDPSEVWKKTIEKTEVLAIQSGEPGPLNQVAAGLDIACWDLWARRQQRPLYRVLGSAHKDSIPAYASGIDPQICTQVIKESRATGFRSFKIKIGFNTDSDRKSIESAVSALLPGEKLMLDANQGWDIESAILFMRSVEGLPIEWIEEPLRANRPTNEWLELQEKINIPIAAGENISHLQNFQKAIHQGTLKFLQPDACKWGGISAVLPIARQAVEAGLIYCPHYLGGGVGLMASAHLLAAVGGGGMLEFDVQKNPLREGLATPFPLIHNGQFIMPQGAGLGTEPDLDEMAQYLVRSREVKAS